MITGRKKDTRKVLVLDWMRAGKMDVTARDVGLFLGCTTAEASEFMRRLNRDRYVQKIGEIQSGSIVSNLYRVREDSKVPLATLRKRPRRPDWHKSHHKTAAELWAISSGHTELERVWGCFTPATVDIPINWRDMVR